MSGSSLLALFLAMGFLAVLPGLSVMTVALRAASGGFVQGAAVAVGVVLGDMIHILLAVGGWQLLATIDDRLLSVLRYLAAMYLIGFSWHLWKSASRSPAGASGIIGSRADAPGHRSGMLAGLMITLADQKALLFYIAFLPAFINLGGLTARDVMAVMLVALIAVGGAKLLWAALGAGIAHLPGASWHRGMNRVAAMFTVTVAFWIIVGGMVLA